MWISGRTFGRYCSMVSCQDRILALTDDGLLLLIEARPDTFALIDARQVAEQETWGGLAVVGQQVFIRGRDALAAYRWHSALAVDEVNATGDAGRRK